MQNYNPLSPFVNGDMGVVPFFKGDFVKSPLVNKGGGVKSPLIKGDFLKSPLTKGDKGVVFFWTIPHFHEDKFTTTSVLLC